MHRSRVPAGKKAISSPPSSIGPNLIPGDAIEYRVSVTDASGQSAISPLDTVTVPTSNGGAEGT